MIGTFRSLFAPPRHYLLLFAALWLGLTLAEKRTERHGVSKEALNNLTFYSILGYVVGGRLLYALANLSAFAPSRDGVIPSLLSIFSPNPDLFSATGGFIIAVLVGLTYGGHRQRLPLWGTLDALTPIFATLAIGLHLAHLTAGTAFGSPTNLPWGIDLWNATRHPTQIYELIAALIILRYTQDGVFALLCFRKSDIPSGILFLNFTALTAGARLLLEAFRGDSTLVFGGLRLAQVVAWVVLAITFFLSGLIRQKTKDIYLSELSPK